MTSTNGTWRIAARKRSGLRFTTAPIRSPPALPPWIAIRSFAATFAATSASAQATKSVKVFFFDIIRPASCHFFPRSPPPRTCATA